MAVRESTPLRPGRAGSSPVVRLVLLALKTKAGQLAVSDKAAELPFMSSLHPLLKKLDVQFQRQLVTEYRRSWGEDAPTLIGW